MTAILLFKFPCWWSFVFRPERLLGSPWSLQGSLSPGKIHFEAKTINKSNWQSIFTTVMMGIILWFIKCREIICCLFSGSYLSSHGPKSSNGTVIINLKSKHPPHTNLLTLISPEAFLISGSFSSNTLEIASKLSEVLLSPSYLHRHSRQTRLKDIAPLAFG